MDSNDLERERGITILAKNTALFYHDVKSTSWIRLDTAISAAKLSARCKWWMEFSFWWMPAKAHCPDALRAAKSAPRQAAAGDRAEQN